MPKIRTSVKELGDKLDAMTPERQRPQPQYIGNFGGDPVLFDGVVVAEKVIPLPLKPRPGEVMPVPLKPVPEEPMGADYFELTGGYRFAHFDKDGMRALAKVNDGDAKLYEVYAVDFVTGKVIAGPMKHGDYVQHASFSPDSKRIVTASRDSTAAIWDAATGKMLAGLMGHGGCRARLV